MKEFIQNTIALLQGIFPNATPPQIIKGIIWAIMIFLNGGFIVYLFFDGRKFSRNLKKDSKNFEKEVKDMAKVFIDSQQKQFDKAVKENAERVNKALETNIERINVLSRENVRLREENDFLFDKLKNMGFSEEQLKP